ncbi:MFS general substrate transporter [Camillea tinctor]|nr:MFS general substrate transporter [Camillea tinctor]
MGNQRLHEPSSGERFFQRDATIEEIQTLIHENERVPATAWLLAFTGAASQFARFGITVTWQNYLQNPQGNPLLPGALGLGQAKATIIQNAFLFFQYLTPLPFALMSDVWIGRYKTMLICLGLLVTGYVVLVVTSIPSALNHGAGIPGIAITMVLIGLGQGGLSAVMYPFIADQIPITKPQVKRNKKGELIVTDRKLTIQYAFNGYYWMVNIAALSSIPTTLMEKHIGFWPTYLLPTCVLVIFIIPVILWNRQLVKLSPEGNVLPHAGHVLLIAWRSRFRLSAADPKYQESHYGRSVPWSASFVDEIRRSLKGCRVIAYFVVFWLCYNQTTNNIISQAGQMTQQGISNDTIQALNPIACIIAGPLIQNVVFPFLRRHRVSFGPIRRMTVAFLFISAGIAYAAGLQQLIYSRGPCYTNPLECPAAVQQNTGARVPNDLSVWLQTPLHFLLAIGEILGLVSLNEYAYSEAPTNMKAVVQALLEIAAAVAAALGIALGPVSRDPWLVIMYASLAGACAFSAVTFLAIFRRHDAIYENRDVEDARDDKGHSEAVKQGDTQTEQSTTPA